MPQFQRTHCYADRPTRFSGCVEHAGWRLKRYDITVDGSPVPGDYEEGERLLLGLLPSPAATVDRPGVGFILRHPGRNQWYIVLNWWDNQNELLQRLLVRSERPGSAWHDPKGLYACCVWDLAVIWHERNAYVRHVLGEPVDVAAYLRDVAGGTGLT